MKKALFSIHGDNTVDLEIVTGEVVAVDMLSIVNAALNAIAEATGESVPSLATRIAQEYSKKKNGE